MKVSTQVVEILAHTDNGYTYRTSKSPLSGKWSVVRWPSTYTVAIPPVMQMLAEGNVWVGVIRASNDSIKPAKFDTDETALIAAYADTFA